MRIRGATQIFDHRYLSLSLLKLKFAPLREFASNRNFSIYREFAQRGNFQLEEAQNLRRSAKLRWSNLQNGANFVS